MAEREHRLMHAGENTGIVVLRWFFGIVFIIAALDKIFHFQGSQAMFGGIFGAAGLLMLILAIIVELAGGIALLANYKVRRTVLFLMVLIIVALIATFNITMGDPISTLREIFIMNTGGGNTAVNFAFLAGLVAIFFGSPK